MSTAATTPALLPPNATSAVVRPSSTMPKPPGVIGIAPMMRTSDHAAKISTTSTSDGRHADGPEAEHEEEEDGQAAGERREREHMPAPREQVDGLVAEAREARPSPLHWLAADLGLRPRDEPRHDVADIVRELVRVEDEHEDRDDDAEHGDADEGRGAEQRRLAAVRP